MFEDLAQTQQSEQSEALLKKVGLSSDKKNK